MTHPRRPEIDHRTIKLLIGLIALSLAFLTRAFATQTLHSISASYWEGGPSQTIFVGFLFAIAAFMLAYNGQSRLEMVLSKVASLAALGVALFPCTCDTHPEQIRHMHEGCAAVMFAILAFFCYLFFKRARTKAHGEARARALIYAVCGTAIVGSMLAVFLHSAWSDAPNTASDVTFWGEAIGLIAFGVSWLTASRALPFITREDERFTPFAAGPS